MLERFRFLMRDQSCHLWRAAMYWADLTSAELDALDRTIPVVLNLAAIEQHGPHLPLDTDSLIGRELLAMADDRSGDHLVILPQLAVGCSGHHMDFPGSLTVSHESFLAYVSDVVQSVYRHGFRNMVLFNSHGGNLAIGQVLLEKLGSAHPENNIFLLTWWQIVSDQLAVVQESGFGGVGHACEFETSLIAYFRPDLLRTAPMSVAAPKPTFPWAEMDMLNAPHGAYYRSIEDISDGTGIVGAPQFASPTKGGDIANIVVSRLIEMLHDIRSGLAV